MRVLLLEPPKIPWEMMGDVVAPPLGLAQLAGCLEQAGIPVEILDANALEIGWKGLGAAIARSMPDLIGITVYTPFVPEVSRAVRVAREAVPQAKIVLGGPHVTFTVEETLETMSEVEVVARGEGDQIIVDLARALEAGDDLASVPGISYRRNGVIVDNPAPAPLDLTQLPNPAFHLMPMERYHFQVLGGPFSTVVASRGCPFRCTFCSEWPFWRGGWRPHDPGMVVEQLDVLANRYGRRNIWFGDDCFNVDGDHVAAICEGILRRGIDVSWYYQGRADLLVKYKDLLPLMGRAGNRMAQIGIEASNDQQRDELNKQLRTETVREAVGLLRQHRIVCQGMFIVGLPSDTPRTVEQKVRLATQLDIDFPIFVIYTLFPGAPDYVRAVAEGRLKLPADYGRHDMAHVLVPPEKMAPRQVYSYARWAVTSIYLHPVRLARALFSPNDWQRHSSGSMLLYLGKQFVRGLVPRVR
jgi:anaerobic magnesium-protoporphyrin IX monomethyl ester cyclase